MLKKAKSQAHTLPRFSRPAFALAISFLLGILAHPILPYHPGFYLLIATILFLTSFLVFRRDLPCNLTLVACLFFTGLIAIQLDQSAYPSTEIGLFTSDDRQLAQLEFTIDDLPQLITPPTGQFSLPPYQSVRATARRVLTTTGWQSATGSLLLHVEPPDPSLFPGNILRAAGWLARPDPPLNPGQFDYSAHYRAQRLLSTFTIRHPGNIQVLSAGPRFSPVNFLRTHARSLLDAGFTPSPDHLLLRALLLGDTDPQLHDIQDLFAQTGTSHLLAISGLHVAILAAFIYLLCCLARLHPRSTAIITLTFVLLYAAATPAHPPVIRATLLTCLFLVGTLFRRNSDSLQLLALAAFVMLVYRPLDLYDLGFDLSFGTVLGLMLLTRPLAETVSRVDPDIALAPRPVTSRFQLWVDGKQHALRNTFIAATVAWFISLPLILHDFERLNPYSILGAVILIIPISISLIAGLFKIFLTLLCPPLAKFLAVVTLAPIHLLHHLVDWLSYLPFSSVTLQPIPIPLMLLYYAALLSILIPRIPLRYKRAIVFAAAFYVLALPILLTWRASRHPNQTRITILAVGAGSCAIVETDAGQTLLFDAGSTGSSDLYRTIIEPFLRTRHLRRIDTAYISHADFDHYGAIPDIAAHTGISRTYITPQFRRDAADTPAAAGMLRALDTLHTSAEILAAPRSIPLSPDTTLDVLWPPPDAMDLSTNDSGLVLRLTVAGRSILFPADIQDPAMQSLLANPDSLHADILIAAHHGSFEKSTPAFVSAVSPVAIISSDDNTPSSKQRTFDSTFADLHPIHTHNAGAISITIDSPTGTITVTPFLSEPPP